MTWMRFWRAVAGFIFAAELLALRSRDPEAPICHTARHDCHLDTKTGRALFCVGWAGLTAWLLPHLFKGAKRSSAAILDS